MSGCMSNLYANNNMTLYLKSGSKVVLPLEDSPIIEFDNGSVKIGNTTYQISDIQKYTFSDNLGISDIDIENRIINVGDDGFMNISKINDAGIVKIYDIKGIEINCDKSIVGDNLLINIVDLLPGNYILVIGTESIKFTKK